MLRVSLTLKITENRGAKSTREQLGTTAMIDKALISQRKTPQQERSKSIFESILEAAARILPVAGFRKSTTNKIAEMAGVSIGSLYQYFPNKEALVSAILERQLRAHAAIVEEKIEVLKRSSSSPPSAEEVIEVLVVSVMGTILKNRKLLRAICSYTFSLGQLTTVIQARKQIQMHVTKLIEENLDKVQISNPEVATYVAINAVAGVIEAIIFDDTDEEFQRKLVAETVALIQNHMTPASRVESGSGALAAEACNKISNPDFFHRL